MTRLYSSVAILAVAALVGGSGLYVWLKQKGDEFSACSASKIAGGDIGGPFTLVDQNGITVTDKDVLAKPALVYFGYTFCPDVCPLDVARNAEAVDILEERGFDVTPVFITIDPERDTPEVLADYAENMHPKLVALTGSEAQVKTASQAYKTFYQKLPSDDGFYLMGHSTFTYLMLPERGFAEFYDRDATSESMANGVACFLEASGTKPAG